MVNASLRLRKKAGSISPFVLGSHNAIFFQGSSNIDEKFILKQFAVDYHSKPGCNVLNVMTLNQVPLEPKRSVGLNKLQEPEFFQKLNHERKLQKLQVITKGEKTEKSKKIKLY